MRQSRLQRGRVSLATVGMARDMTDTRRGTNRHTPRHRALQR